MKPSQQGPDHHRNICYKGNDTKIINYSIFVHDSSSSKRNTDSTGSWNIWEIFKAIIIEGVYSSRSSKLIVCLDIPASFASSVWFKPSRARSSFKRFFSFIFTDCLSNSATSLRYPQNGRIWFFLLCYYIRYYYRYPHSFSVQSLISLTWLHCNISFYFWQWY